MPTEKKRLTMIPDVEALAVCGCDIRPERAGPWAGASEQLNGILRRHARFIEQAGREVAAMLNRAEWLMLASALQNAGKMADRAESAILALTQIRANVQDADALEDAGKRFQVDVAKLLEKLAGLTPVHGEAILAAVRWFQAHCETIRNEKHDWWLPAFRRNAVQEG